MKRSFAGCAVGSLMVLVGVVGPGSATAAAERTDPRAGSPGGVIYQIPLDSGRRDAAPVLPGGRRHPASSASAGGGSGAGGPGSGGAPGGAGSSPGGGGGPTGSGGGSGTGATGAGTTGGAGAAASANVGTAENPSSIHSENGFGSSSQVPGVSPAADVTGAGVPSAHAAGSTLPSYLLMVLIGVAAVAVGLVASRATRRSATQ